MIFTFIQSAVGGSFSFLLDDYPTGAYYARSVARKLRTAYSGSAIRIRRSSDNTEQDIGFASNVLDTAAITTFVGANSAYVVKMYDQTGNGFHWEQSTAGYQPRIVNAGTLETINGKPAAKYDGTDDIMNIPTWSRGTSSSWMHFMVHQFAARSSAGHNATGNGASSRYWEVWQNGSASVPYDQSGTPSYYKNGASISATRDALYDNFTAIQALSSIININLNNIGWTGMYDSYGGGFEYEGYIQEDVLYDAQTESQSGIETQINDFYAIF